MIFVVCLLYVKLDDKEYHLERVLETLFDYRFGKLAKTIASP